MGWFWDIFLSMLTGRTVDILKTDRYNENESKGGKRMERFDPVIDLVMKIGNGTLGIGINENAHEIAGVFVGDTHNHSRFELHIVLEGTCQVDVEGSSHLVSAGYAICIAPGQHHRLIPTTSDPKRLTVGLSMHENSFQVKLAEVLSQQNIYQMPQPVLELVRSIMKESCMKHPFYREVMRSQMAELVVMFLRLVGMEEQTDAPDRETFRPQDVIDNYFEECLAHNPCADDLAAKLHISRRHLNRILQSIYGKGFREKLLLARMDRAKWLLRHTDKSIGVVAGEVGYAHDSAFRQTFRQQFGMTPFEYRLRRRRNIEKENMI